MEDRERNEEWRDIRGYEGRYQVSNLGRIKSLARFRAGKNNSPVPVPERIMKTAEKKETHRTKPYKEIKLRNGGSRKDPCKSFLVHRLVADAFIKRLEHKEQVDHINGIHGDNRVENLRVLTVVDHGKIHPIIANPPLRNVFTGRYTKNTGDIFNKNDKKLNILTDKEIYHRWFLTNVVKYPYFGA